MARRKNRPSPPPPARRGAPATIAELLPAVGGEAFRRFGFRQATLAARWREVVGPLYARWSVPEAIRKARGGEPALHILVEGPFAPQLQHVAPRIIEAVNRLLGPGTVSRIRLRQGVVPKRAAASPAHPPAASRATTPNLAGIRDPELRSALERLAAALSAPSGPVRGPNGRLQPEGPLPMEEP